MSKDAMALVFILLVVLSVAWSNGSFGYAYNKLCKACKKLMDGFDMIGIDL